jgi:sterol desaturase/sphingolipid hydroxylase (fatty acid hydroxylase superfamily)
MERLPTRRPWPMRRSSRPRRTVWTGGQAWVQAHPSMLAPRHPPIRGPRTRGCLMRRGSRVESNVVEEAFRALAEWERILRASRPLPSFPWTFVLVAVAYEYCFPKTKLSARSRFRGLPWWILEHALAVTVVVTLQTWVTEHTPWSPLFRLVTAPDTSLPALLVAPFLAVFLVDFFYYWFHRAQHRFRLLWRLHSVHHAIRELSVLNVYHHWTDRLLWVFFVFAPLSVFFEISVPRVLGISFFVRFYMESIHANARLRFGPLKFLITEPRFHRIHHSLEERHHQRNFSAFFPIIDVLFGIAYFPEGHEHPDTGLADQAEVRTLRDYLLARGDRLTPEPGERHLSE